MYLQNLNRAWKLENFKLHEYTTKMKKIHNLLYPLLASNSRQCSKCLLPHTEGCSYFKKKVLSSLFHFCFTSFLTQ